MKIHVIASGSKGNCTFIETENSKILIDLGLSNLSLENKLNEININVNEIDSVFITHTHVDHIAGLKVFNKKHNATIFLTKKMYDEITETIDLKNYFIFDDIINLNDVIVTPFKTSHDTNDSVGYVFLSNNSSLVYVTDTGYINQKYFEILKNRNAYIFESNHDVQLLMDNPNYPYQTKQRILSDKGHLSNKDSAYYMSKLMGNNTKHIVLAHLSEQNNTPSLAMDTMKEKLGDSIDIVVAKQNEILDVIEV